MNILQDRAKNREKLVRLAKDSNVQQLAELYLFQYRDDLEHLKTGDQIAEHIPVGRDKFNQWVKQAIDEYYPSLSGLTENDRVLKEYANQVADSIAKSNTDVQNPLKDYEVSNDPIYVKAQEENSAVGPNKYSPAEPSIENLYMRPDEQTRYDPENPGVMLKRISDKVYQSPITGNFYQFGTWDDVYNAYNGKEVTFETGVQNQSNGAWNELHPMRGFLDPPKQGEEPSDYKKTHSEGYEYTHDGLYGVFENKENLISPHEVKDVKGAEDPLDRLTRKGEHEDGCPCCECPKAECSCSSDCEGCDCKKEASLKTAQFFSETTMPTRQCPDHPGMQTVRVEDNVRQCLLDNRIYDFNAGFTTDDGEHHPGGSVSAQHSIPPGSSIVRLDKQAALNKQAETQQTHAFLWNVLQYLPAESRERKILNLKFQKNLPIDEAIAQYEEAERLAAEQEQQTQQ